MKLTTTDRRARAFRAIKGFRVEPVAFLNFIAMGIFQIVNQVGTYRVICYHTIGDDPRFNCSEGGGDKHGRSGLATKLSENFTSHGGHHNLASNHSDHAESSMESEAYKELENQVQQAAVTWNLIFQLAHSLPALFADTILGALGDRHGRKANIMIGLAGTMVSMYPLTIIFTYKDSPLFILIISGLISGFTGFMSIIMISCYAYLADTVVDHEMLTVRMTYYTVIMSVASIFSPLIGSALLRKISYAQTTLVCLGILTAAFFLTLLIVKQLPPLIMRKIMLEKYIEEHGHAPPAGNEKFEKYRLKIDTEPVEELDTNKGKKEQKKKGCQADLKSIWKSFLQLWKEVYITFKKPRPGHARLYLLFASLVYFLHTAFEGGLRSNVFGLYVQKSPFNWGPDQISAYKSVNGALHLAGSMIGVVILKKFLKLSDTTVILIAMGTHTIETVLYACANSTATLYVAAAAGCMSQMVPPCIKSFISQLVNPDEVGKSFTAFGIATNVAHMTSNVLYSSIYKATVAWFPGFSFLVASGLELVCICMFLWLHCDYHFDGQCVKVIKTKINGCLNKKKDEAVDFEKNSKAAERLSGLKLETLYDVTL